MGPGPSAGSGQLTLGWHEASVLAESPPRPGTVSPSARDGLFSLGPGRSPPRPGTLPSARTARVACEWLLIKMQLRTSAAEASLFR